MAAPDYLIFEPGNPLTETYCDEWYQTLDLFGYFEQFRVRQDGTLWITPTQLVPSEQERNVMNAPELVKIQLPPVQILVGHKLTAVSEKLQLEIVFKHGVITEILASTRAQKLAA